MSESLLYVQLKNKIMKKIYAGVYNNGELLPSERLLSQEYGVSRATIRKALASLKQENIITYKVGTGNYVSLNTKGYNGKMDVIALVAPAQRRFFATFINYFQKVADKHQTLVVFLQQSENEKIEDTLFKLLEHNIHNVVIWLDYKTIQNKYIQRLRGLGMNMVFFDIIQDTPYADCICLDNEHAISTIYQYVRDKGHQNVVYVSRENISPSSYLERDIAFSKLNPLGMVWTFPWDFKNYLANRPDDFVFDYFMPYYKPSSIICSDGELGIMLKKSFQKHGIRDVFLVSLDDFDECEELGITVYKQDYNLFAEKIFSCLTEQNSNYVTWKANTYRIKGELIIRE